MRCRIARQRMEAQRDFIAAKQCEEQRLKREEEDRAATKRKEEEAQAAAEGRWSSADKLNDITGDGRESGDEGSIVSLGGGDPASEAFRDMEDRKNPLSSSVFAVSELDSSITGIMAKWR